MSADNATAVAAIRLGLHALRENVLGDTAAPQPAPGPYTWRALLCWILAGFGRTL